MMSERCAGALTEGFTLVSRHIVRQLAAFRRPVGGPEAVEKGRSEALRRHHVGGEGGARRTETSGSNA